MELNIVEGDLLDQQVDVIVNAWNRNVIPWWMLVPHGVSGAIKGRAGYGPFRELARHGPIPLGGAVATGPGTLACKAIIHVAGINLLWVATNRSIQDSVRHAVELASRNGWRSIAMPLIGAGVGGSREEEVLALMRETLAGVNFDGEVRIVRLRKVLNARGCYCSLWEKSPQTLEKQGVPRGYCGICERCGKPGHLRHAPGTAPYTGAWCDRCYRMLAIGHYAFWFMPITLFIIWVLVWGRS
jgi:O-acetyl-ADP-ribose deacetylase